MDIPVDFLDTQFSGSMTSMDTSKATAEDEMPSRSSFEAESPLYKTDEFRMYCFKVLPCSKRYCHDWTTCPFAHPGEKAKRRDPRVYQYTGIACPEMKKNLACPRGETCPYAHNVFEYWLHPSRYRTQLCNDGVNCKRKVCFFAHTLEELRVPACKPVLPDATMDVVRPSDTDAGFPAHVFLNSGDANMPKMSGGSGSPVSILGTGNDMWEVGNSPSTTPTSTWSPYNAAMPYPDLSATDSSSGSLLSGSHASPAPNTAALEQLAQTLASMNINTAAAADQAPLTNILSLLMNQQVSAQHHPTSSPLQPQSLAPPSAAAAAAAVLMPQQQQQNLRGSVYGRSAGPRPNINFNSPSPSACILGNKMQPAPTSAYQQSSLYAPSVPTLAQLQQAAQQAQAAYAAELDSMRRRSLDSATQTLYSRTIAAQQAQAASGSRRSLDTYAPNFTRNLQQRWGGDADTTLAMAQFALQQQQMQQQHQHQQAMQHQHDHAADEAEQLLRSAFTSASKELSSDEERSQSSLSVGMSANLDNALSASLHAQASDSMLQMLSDLQQQQQYSS